MPRCACGSGLSYDECCGPYHRGEATPATAEALMRSRFTAFAIQDAAYLRRTWDPRTRPKAINFSEDLRWTRLEVTGTTGGGLFDHEGTVQFAAHYRDGGKPGVMRENSSFTRASGQWIYTGPVR